MEQNKVMKTAVLGLAGLLSGLLLNTSVQAAPISYRFDPEFHVELQWLNGVNTPIGFNGPLIPASTPLVLLFTYDSGVTLTPQDLPPNPANIIYVDSFDAAGAFANIAGSLGSYRFGASNVTSRSWSYTTPNMVPSDMIYTLVGAVGQTVGDDGSAFSGVFGGQNFTLSYISLAFAGGPVSSVLPSQLWAGGGVSQLQLQFNGDDGTIVTASYFGSLTEVPVPAAFWLFGSALLAPITLRMRKRN